MSDMNDHTTEGHGYLSGPVFGGGSGGPGGEEPAGAGAAGAAAAAPAGGGAGAGVPPAGDHGTYAYGMYPPPPPPPRPSHHKRALVITGVAALALGAAAGGLVNTLHTSSSGTATATSKTGLSASQIAARVDPGLVDVISTDGDVQPDGAMSYGTGIVLTATGEILTNNHVIEGATSVKVIDIGNGKTYKANVVGYDAGHDVAVLQLADASGLTIASLGDSSSVAVGNSVTALGNAEGKNGTPSVASGTVTALNQSITASDELSSTNEQLTGLIESNTPIEPGDSGGPLVNAYGQVVGMDTAASSSYQFQGVGQNQNSGATDAYTIPIGEAIQLAQDIESGNATGTIHIGATAFMGIEISTENQSDTGGLGGLGGLGGQGTGGQGSGGQGSGGQGSGGQQQGNGAELAGVLQNSPAANAGLAEGDTITSLGGQSVTDSEDVQHILVKYHPGDSVPVTWVDGAGTQHTSTLKLTSGPAA